MAPRTWLAKARALFTRHRLDRDLDDEVQSHLDLLAADYEHRGLTQEAARLAARRAFGGVEQMKETYRDRRGLRVIDECLRDCRFGVRLLIKERSFTAAAVCALALGLAATNSVFVLMNGFLLRGLPFANPDRIVSIGTSIGGSDRANAGISYLDLRDVIGGQRTFDGLGAVMETTMNVADDRRAPERFVGAFVSANTFDLIGRAPAIGRTFDASDERPTGPAIVVLGDAIWRNRYGADPAVIGRTIRVNGIPSVVIGVMEQGFRFPARSELWQTIAQLPADLRERRDARGLQGLGRLTRGTTTPQATDDLRGIATALEQRYPETNRNAQPRVSLFRDGVLGGRTRTVFPILLTMVWFVLLIACANVANLLLARGAYRSREIALRLAIGASRAHIVRQLLIESVLLAAIAGLIGLALSMVGIDLFSKTINQMQDVRGAGLPYWISFSMDWRVFTFLAALCLATALVFGAMPAIHASKTSVVGVLAEAGTGSSASVLQRRWTSRLVVAQLALTPILLSAAGLMVRSIAAQQQIDAGVDTARLVRMRLDLSGPNYRSPESRERFYRQLEDRFAAASSLGAALASQAPFEGSAFRRLSIDGRAALDDRGRPFVRVMTVGRGYFETLGTSPVRGATFTVFDDGRNPTSAIVNERFVSTYMKGADPIGHRLDLTGARPPTGPEQVQIIGVAPNIRQSSTEDQASFEPMVYVPYLANPLPVASVLVRTGAAPAAAAALVLEQVRAIDRDLPVFDVMTLDQSLAGSDERVGLRLFGTILAAIASIALILATVGLYSVTAYSTAHRRREIGIRVALGSNSTQIGWLIVRHASRQLTVGLAIGATGALALGQLMRGLVIGIGPGDPWTMLGIVALMSAVVCAASFVPVRRAMRLNPVIALRGE
jgi:predicted permease